MPLRRPIPVANTVARVKRDDRRGELERDGEGEQAQSDLPPFGCFDPSELQPGHDERRSCETEEAEAAARLPGEERCEFALSSPHVRRVPLGSRSFDHDRLRCAHLDSGEEPVRLSHDLGVTFRGDFFQLSVASRFRGLHRHRPRDRHAMGRPVSMRSSPRTTVSCASETTDQSAFPG